MKVLFYHHGSEPWFGVSYLSAALKKAGHRTELIMEPPKGLFFKVPFVDRIDIKNKLVKKAVSYNPDLIAISSTTYAFPHVKKMATMLKNSVKAPIIIGGIHATLVPDFVLDNSDVDMLCRGEGDEAIVEVANAIEKNESVHNIKNVWVKKEDGTIIKNEVRPLIESLDKLPFPDTKIFEKYNCIEMDYHISSSRGCPYNCSYCCNNFYRGIYQNKGKYVRRRSPKNVIAELKEAKKRYPLQSVYFWDDVFTSDLKWLADFCKMYKEDIDLPFHCLSRPELIKKETVDILKNAGCSHINIGIESGSDKIRRNVLNRYMTNEQIINAARIIKKANIKLNAFSMFGIPDESPEDMLETVNLNLEVKPDGVFTMLMTLFPELQITKHALKVGLTTEEKIRQSKKGGLNNFGGIKNHPHRNIAVNLRALLPIMSHLPKSAQKILIKRALKGKSISKLTNTLSFFFFDPSRTKHVIKAYVLSLIKLIRNKDL